jgi:predicted N-formylglutamate amidohydrolase
MTVLTAEILEPDEPLPVKVERVEGRSAFFLACDHASNVIPRRLGTLQLELEHLERHIAWDIGAAVVARKLSERLDATLVLQGYSRLVIDCNRSPEVPSSIPILSEHTAIPGNESIHPAHAEARAREIFHPYHDRIMAELEARKAAARDTVLVAVHSFTPVFKGRSRPWHIGILYNRDARLARILLELLAEQTDLCVGDNEPYSISDETDYTIPVHGERRGIPHVEIEIRQDLIGHQTGQEEWTERLADLLQRALERITW